MTTYEDRLAECQRSGHERLVCAYCGEDVAAGGPPLPWLLVIRNEAWTFPDIFGPFGSEQEAMDWADTHINHDTVDDADINYQQILDTDYYDEEGNE